MDGLAVLAPVGLHARLAPPEPVRVAVHDLVGLADVGAVVDERQVGDAGPVVVGVEGETCRRQLEVAEDGEGHERQRGSEMHIDGVDW